MIVASVLACIGTQASSKVTLIGPFAIWGPELRQALETFSARTQIEVEILQATGWPDLLDKVITRGHRARSGVWR